MEFKKLNTQGPLYSVRIGLGWRAVGVAKTADTIVWFWIGSHSEYDKLLKKL
ncbi:ParE family toxin-like protein [Trichothermofontia sp.]